MNFKKFNEYINSRKSKSKSKKTIKKDASSLGEVGDKNLVYNPKTAPLQNKAENPWAKTNIKEWIQKNRNTPTSEVIKQISEEKFNVQIDYKKIKTNQDLIEAAAELLKSNNSLIENFILELKRSSLLNKTLKTIHRVVEGVSPPIGDEEENYEGDEEGDEEENYEGDEESDEERNYEDDEEGAAEGAEEGNYEDDEEGSYEGEEGDEEGNYEDDEEGSYEGDEEDEEGDEEEEIDYEDEDEDYEDEDEDEDYEDEDEDYEDEDEDYEDEDEDFLGR